MHPVHNVHAIYMAYVRIRDRDYCEPHSLDDELLAALPWAIRKLYRSLDSDGRAELRMLVRDDIAACGLLKSEES
jgi:hypothetical protein